MTLSATDKWKEGAARGDLRPVFRVHIGAVKGSGGHIATFTLGPLNYDEDAAVGVDVQAFQKSIDPMSGSGSSGDMTVILSGHDVVRESVSASRLGGKDLIVTLGWNISGFGDSDFLSFFGGKIKSVKLRADKSIVLRAVSIDLGKVPTSTAGLYGRDARRGHVMSAFYSGATSTASYTVFDETAISSNAHPLPACADILENAGVPSRFIDSTSFAQATAANDDIKHYKVGWVRNNHADSRIRRDLGAIEIVKRIAFMCRGVVRVNEDGKISYKYIDPTEAIAGTFDGNQIIADSFTVDYDLDRIIARVAVETCAAATGDDGSREPRARFTLEDRTFQDNWGHSTSSTERMPHTFELKDDYFGARGVNYTNWTPSPSNIVVLHQDPDDEAEPNITIAMFNSSGNKGDFCGSHASGNFASSARKNYYLLQELSGRLTEIVSVENTVFTNTPSRTTSGTVTSVHGDTIYSGTEATGEVTIYDITVPYLRAKSLIEQYGEGAEVVTFETNFKAGADGVTAFEYQVGDVVAIDDDRYLTYGQDGTPSSDKFLILEKSLTPLDGRIAWKLQRLRTSSVSLTVPGINHFADLDDPNIARAPGTLTGGTSAASWVDMDATWGFGPNFEEGGVHGTTSGTLTATMPRTRLNSGRSHRSRPQESITYRASKDAYVWAIYNQYDSSFWYEINDQTIGTAPPAAPTTASDAQYVALMRVRTDGTEVTDVVDLRPRGIVRKVSAAPTEQTTTHRQEKTSNHVIEPLVISGTSASNFSATLESAKAVIKGEVYDRTIPEIVTLGTLKAVWIYLRNDGGPPGQGAFEIVNGTVGAGEPSTNAFDGDAVLIGVVETDLNGTVEVRTTRVSHYGGGGSANLLNPGEFGIVPNGSMEAMDHANSQPLGWSWEVSGSATVAAVSGDDVKLGKHGLKVSLTTSGDDATIRSRTFPIAPVMQWNAWTIYSNSNSNDYTLTAGLELLDADYEVITVRGALATSENVTANTSTQGALKYATYTGVGATASTLPANTRFARFYIKAEYLSAATDVVFPCGFIAPAV